MKKSIALVIILASSIVYIKAQEKLSDSLFTKSKKFWYNNTDSAKFFLRKALESARAVKYLKGEANVLKGMGFLAKSNAERLQFYFKALAIRQQLNDSLGIGVSLFDIGTVYRTLGDHDKKSDYFSRSLSIRRKIKDHGGIAQSLIEVGHSLEDDGDYNKALQIYRESLQHRLAAGEINGIAYSHTNIAAVFAKLKQPDSSLIYSSIAEKEFINANNKTVSSWMHLIRGECYYLKDETAKSIDELIKVDSIGIYFLPSILLLSEIYERQKDFKQALIYQKKWMIGNKKRENELNATVVRELAADYEFKIQQSETERKDELNRQRKKRQDNLQLLLIAIGLIGVFVFIISIRKKFSERTVNLLMFVGFMFLFEFVVVLIDPSLQNISGNNPVLLLLGNTIVALVIAPLHGFVEKYFKKKMKVSDGAI